MKTRKAWGSFSLRRIERPKCLPRHFCDLVFTEIYGDWLAQLYSQPYYGGYYDYSQPYASQTWYYCSDLAGYYPYVTQCSTGWQAVPAS